MSAMGHLYYMELLPRKEVKGEEGAKEEQKFRLRWRKTPMEKRTRNAPASHVASEKKASETKETPVTA